MSQGATAAQNSKPNNRGMSWALCRHRDAAAGLGESEAFCGGDRGLIRDVQDGRRQLSKMGPRDVTGSENRKMQAPVARSSSPHTAS